MYDPHHAVLTKDEEYELAVKMKAGCERSKEKLIRHNSRLVYKIAQKFVTPVPIEELVQEGMIGLIKSLEKFDPEQGFKISTYATNYIRWSIMHALKKAPHYGDEVEYEDGKNATPFDEGNYADIKAIEEAMATLTDHERMIVSNHHFGDMPVTQIAESMNRSREAVRQVLKKAYRKMKFQMETEKWVRL